MAKNKADADRRARVEQMRKAEKAKERRRTYLVVGSAVVVVAILVGLVVVTIRNSLAEKDPSAIGVAASAASCDAVTTDAVTGSSVHVGPGTDQTNITHVDYAQIPAVSGEHFVTPAYPASAFYTEDDRPAIETLVHNEEHGYTILWYTKAATPATIDELKKISDVARADSATGGKFIVAPWDESRGEFPAGKTIALSHWGAKQGHRQLCGQLSGEAVMSFVKAYPYTDSSEPNGA